MPIPYRKQAYLKPMLWVALFLLLGLSVLLFSFLQAHAQPNPPPRPIQYGQSVSDSLTSPQAEMRWAFEARAGEMILLDMLVAFNSRLDPRLQVVDAKNQLIAEANQMGSLLGGSAHIGPLILPSAGPYQIVVSAYNGLGDFTLYLHNFDHLPSLTLDKPLSLNLDAAWELRYLRYDSLEAAQLRFEIEPASDRAQAPLIRIYSPAGDRLNNSAYRRLSLIDPFLSQADTPYIIGLYLLPYEPPISQQFQVLLSLSDIQFLADQDQQIGTINTEQAFPEHYFLAQAGDTVQISLRSLSGGISPSIVVTGGAEDSILFSGNSAHTQHLSLSLNIPADGLYVIRVNDGAYRVEGGTYALEFMRQPAP